MFLHRLLQLRNLQICRQALETLLRKASRCPGLLVQERLVRPDLSSKLMSGLSPPRNSCPALVPLELAEVVWLPQAHYQPALELEPKWLRNAYIHTYMHIHTHTYIHKFIHTYIHNSFMRAAGYIHTYIFCSIKRAHAIGASTCRCQCLLSTIYMLTRLG